jgi:hypothetical protein
MSTPRFSITDPTEKVVLTFDFTNGLATGETLTGATAVPSVTAGTDPTPQARITTVQVQGNLVLLAFANGLAGTDYHLLVTATTSNSNKVLSIAQTLPIRNL